MNNTGVIFRQSLHDNRKSIFWWGVCMAALAFYMVIVYPLISEFQQFNQLMESPIFVALVGSMQGLEFTTPAGFLGVEFFSWAPLVLAVYAVLFGLGIVGGEEARGTLDLLLSAPVPRWRVIAEKSATFVIGLAVILGLTLIAMVLGVAVTPGLDIGPGMIAVGMLNVMPVVALMAAITLLLTTVLRSRTQAGGIAAGIIVASYFLNSLAGLADSEVLRGIQHLSFYKYYNPFGVLVDGIEWGNFLFLLAVTGALFLGSIYFFQRRDLSA